MKKVLFIVVLLALLTSAFASADDIEVVPDVTTLNLIAGGVVAVNVTVTFSCNNPSIINLSVEILPDGDGINITFYGVPEDIEKNKEYTILMVANTSIALMPGQYTIKMIFNCSCTENPSGGGSDNGGNTKWFYGNYGDGESDDEQVPPDQEPDEEPKEDENGNENENNDVKEKYWMFPYFLAVIIAIIFFIVLTSYEIGKNRKKDKEQKEEKKNE